VRPASPVSLPRALGAEMRSPGAEALYHEIALQLHKADPKYAELERNLAECHQCRREAGRGRIPSRWRIRRSRLPILRRSTRPISTAACRVSTSGSGDQGAPEPWGPVLTSSCPLSISSLSSRIRSSRKRSSRSRSAIWRTANTHTMVGEIAARRVLRLTLLAPEIVEALLDGAASPGPRGPLRLTRGLCGSRLLCRKRLAPSTPRRSPDASR